MGRFIEGCDRREQVFLPACIDDYVAEDNPVRVVDLFVDELDMAFLGFADAASTGRPGCRGGLPSTRRRWSDTRREPSG